LGGGGKRDMRIAGEYRECKDCQRVLPFKKFKAGNYTYRKHTCTRCHNIRNRYGISGRDFYKMLEEQLSCCLICEDFITDDTANVDHCHTNKNVRALLCRLCNLAIGHLKHDKEIASRAVEYLIKHTNELDDK
jgi:hypothetical protein